VNPVSRAKNIAARDTIEAQDDLLRSARLPEGSGKLERLTGLQANERPKRPAIFRPISGCVKRRPVAERVQGASKAKQISLGTTGRRVSAAHQSNVGEWGSFGHRERNLPC
jgi:hypothetical protein